MGSELLGGCVAAGVGTLEVADETEGLGELAPLPLVTFLRMGGRSVWPAPSKVGSLAFSAAPLNLSSSVLGGMYS